jgi:SAM-dependent methyltransferase
MTLPDAIRYLRSQPRFAELMRDSYLDGDVVGGAERFRESGEWRAVVQLLEGKIAGARVLDVGAGTGMASAAFVGSGAAEVIALEPDSSEEGGRAAISVLNDPQIRVVEGLGESIRLPNASVDIVYVRQTLHHAADLPQMLRECARVLRPGGRFLACREHVVDNPKQLAAFVASHPVHQVAGTEHAFALPTYLAAIRDAGLTITRVWGPYDSVINAFPLVDSDAELAMAPALRLAKLGMIGRIAARVPLVTTLVRVLVNRHPGRLYTFFATK